MPVLCWTVEEDLDESYSALKGQDECSREVHSASEVQRRDREGILKKRWHVTSAGKDA